MLPDLDDYDWKEVFEYANPTVCEKGHTHGPAAIIGDQVSTASFSREDVIRVIAMENGENDGDTWVGVFELRDGRFASIRAGCDYTGWD